jgi:hypothetical protein
MINKYIYIYIILKDKIKQKKTFIKKIKEKKKEQSKALSSSKQCFVRRGTLKPILF